MTRISTTLAVVLTCALTSASAADRPNVVFILADDLGWSDTTLYGTTSFYETPNIERLAQRGMLFTNAYTAHPLCSPTRSSIMTGQDPARTGFTSAAGMNLRLHHPAITIELIQCRRHTVNRFNNLVIRHGHTVLRKYLLCLIFV